MFAFITLYIITRDKEMHLYDENLSSYIFNIQERIVIILHSLKNKK